MLRSSLLALFALSISSVSRGNPLATQAPLVTNGPIHTTEGWGYSDCGVLKVISYQIPLR